MNTERVSRLATGDPALLQIRKMLKRDGGVVIQAKGNDCTCISLKIFEEKIRAEERLRLKKLTRINCE